MEPPQRELTLEESVKQVMRTLPPSIRQYLGQGKYSPVAKHLMEKYGLHIDQGTVLEREIMLLLMGIESPDEFVQALTEEARLDEKTIRGIMGDVNEQIFIPLRDEMRRADTKKEELKGPPPPPSYPPKLPVPRPPQIMPPPPPHPSPKATVGAARQPVPPSINQL